MQGSDFIKRHIGPTEGDRKAMLDAVGTTSVDELIEKTIPSQIRLKGELNVSEGLNEYEYLDHIRELAGKNKVFDNYIGLGYYGCYVPSVILRNVFENPGWYTAYTPYQAEISQGRLEMLLNFQTMISDLTQLPLAVASLLDEGTAACEAMQMCYGANKKKESVFRSGSKSNSNLYFNLSILVEMRDALG